MIYVDCTCYILKRIYITSIAIVLDVNLKATLNCKPRAQKKKF